MVRPLLGERAKKVTTISVDPEVWSAFQRNVANKVFPATSASGHLEALMRQENDRLSGNSGEKTVSGADVAKLQKRLLDLQRDFFDVQKRLEKREGALERFENLAGAYYLDFEGWSNSADVIRQVLIDRKRDGSPVQSFLEGEPESDLLLFVHLVEISAEMSKVNRQLLDSLEGYYGIEQKPEQTLYESKEQGQVVSEESSCVETKDLESSTDSEEQVVASEEEEDCEVDPDYWEESDETEWTVREE